MKKTTIQLKFSGVYFFLYFAIGTILPLLALYLHSIGLTGVQIGVLTAIGSFVSLFSSPFWGYISDRTHRHKSIILTLMSFVVIAAFLISLTQTYYLLIPLFILYYFAFSPLNPLIDGFALHSPIPFGQIRLWGSIGFAIAAFGIGQLITNDSLVLIFYIFMGSLLLTGLIFSNIHQTIDSGPKMTLHDLKILLMNRQFILFLLYSLLISSTINGNNIYFGLYYKSLGGTISLIGFAFFLFALSEAPLMQITPYFIAKFGLNRLLLLAPIIGVARWFYYASSPSPTMILVTFLFQGLFYTPFLLGAAEYIRSEVAPNLRSTAMALFTSIGFGIGGILSNLISGFMLDYTTPNNIYGVYTFLCFLAVLVIIPIYRKLGPS